MAVSWPCAALAAAILLTAACTGLPNDAVDDSLVPERLTGVTGKLAWTGCRDDELRQLRMQCATLTVPLDYADPGGTKIRLAVSRLRHKVPKQQFLGVMLTNPGGPGEPGLAVPTLVDGLPRHVSDRYDWIGFDPRGIGASRPAVHCDPDNDLLYRRTYVTQTAAEVAGWRKQAERYAAACGERSGRLLEHMTTLDTAFDLESIRRSLGATRVSYYGFSYGTYLGAVYATRFPDRLDKPGKIGRNEWVDAFLTGLYSPDNWDTSATMWTNWLRSHDPLPIVNTLRLEPENTRAASLAVTCTDAPWPALETLLRDTRSTYEKARLVTWANTWQSAPCVYWPAPAAQPVTVSGKDVRSALLIDQTHDGATPYAGSLELRRLLPRASLVAVPGGTAHAESLTGNIPCVGGHVADYLVSGKLPKRLPGSRADATCKANVVRPG